MINLCLSADVVNIDNINRILEIVLSVVGTLLTGICVYAFKLAKRNGVVRELANVMGEYIDTLVLETKNEIAMWEERKLAELCNQASGYVDMIASEVIETKPSIVKWANWWSLNYHNLDINGTAETQEMIKRIIGRKDV